MIIFQINKQTNNGLRVSWLSLMMRKAEQEALTSPHGRRSPTAIADDVTAVSSSNSGSGGGRQRGNRRKQPGCSIPRLGSHFAVGSRAGNTGEKQDEHRCTCPSHRWHTIIVKLLSSEAHLPLPV